MSFFTNLVSFCTFSGLESDNEHKPVDDVLIDLVPLGISDVADMEVVVADMEVVVLESPGPSCSGLPAVDFEYWLFLSLTLKKKNHAF